MVCCAQKPESKHTGGNLKMYVTIQAKKAVLHLVQNMVL